MKYRFIFSISACLTLVFSFSTISYMQNSRKENIKLTITSLKEAYSLGEVVSISLEVKNIGGTEAIILGDLPPAKIFVSRDASLFRESTDTTRIKDDAKRVPLKLPPNSSVVKSETILWNSDRRIDDSTRNWEQPRVLTDYVFPEAGDYYVKAEYIIYLSAKPVVIESKPIKITIVEPEGKSLEIWNKIKDRGDFAYFIQYGEFLAPSYKSQERAKFQQEVEQILVKYPNDFYTETLRQNLSKFQMEEAKRQEARQKLKMLQ